MNSLNKTFLPSEKYENRNWFIIDCKRKKLGRLATYVVKLLKGKRKPYYYPSIDVGDYVILINADSILFKENIQQFYINNPGRPGRSLKKISNSFPRLILERAVKGMLSESETRKFIKRLNIYNDQEHPHQAQNPIKIDI
uniref:Large ribosomal subunit protein uL13c n=1 Tax=Plagiogramma staurophorum TaxID=1003089 RepID=A0A2U9NMM7_9STRA|nr:ribosomal protein L13 [Plagiogramma staurophorum]AWT38341.1 ribosomal protein L13 [Plagiogramma staurophorum]